jgi:hypothetical protein
MAGQDRRARRRALGLDIVVLEAQSLAGQGIDAWRGRQAAVAADVPPTDVVAHDETTSDVIERSPSPTHILHASSLWHIRVGFLVSSRSTDRTGARLSARALRTLVERSPDHSGARQLRETLEGKQWRSRARRPTARTSRARKVLKRLHLAQPEGACRAATLSAAGQRRRGAVDEVQDPGPVLRHQLGGGGGQ